MQEKNGQGKKKGTSNVNSKSAQGKRKESMCRLWTFGGKLTDESKGESLRRTQKIKQWDLRSVIRAKRADCGMKGGRVSRLRMAPSREVCATIGWESERLSRARQRRAPRARPERERTKRSPGRHQNSNTTEDHAEERQRPPGKKFSNQAKTSKQTTPACAAKTRITNTPPQSRQPEMPSFNKKKQGKKK